LPDGQINDASIHPGRLFLTHVLVVIALRRIRQRRIKEPIRLKVAKANKKNGKSESANGLLINRSISKMEFSGVNG
jgi:hypothetical protein